MSIVIKMLANPKADVDDTKVLDIDANTAMVQLDRPERTSDLRDNNLASRRHMQTNGADGGQA